MIPSHDNETKIKAIICALSLICCVLDDAHAGISTMSKEIKKIADQFSEKVKGSGNGNSTLAVLPFQMEGSLSRKGIGLAVSNMLAHHISERREFKVVERIELARIMEEQKLSLTGAIENETAVEVGHLLGSSFLILGNVGRLRNAYQINARLVNTETGEILSTSFTELNRDTFDEEVKYYLPLVAEMETIGVLAEFYSPLFEAPSVTQAFNQLDETHYQLITKADGAASRRSFSIGVRYFPYKKAFVDMTVYPGSMSHRGRFSIEYYSAPLFQGENRFRYNLAQGLGYSGSLNAMAGLTKRINITAGIGVFHSSYKLDFVAGANHIYLGPPRTYSLPATQSQSEDFDIPFFTSSIEWKIQQRLGISLRGTYYHGCIPPLTIDLSGDNGETLHIEVFKPELIHFNMGLSAALYF